MNNFSGCPSWVIIRDKLIATIGQDPHVEIGRLEEIECDRYCIPISVCGRAKADAIRRLVPREYKYGNVIVFTQVYADRRIVEGAYCPTNARQIANTLCTGLQGNYLFECVVLPGECNCILSKVYAIMSAKCIRVWGPGGGVYEELASNLFAEVLNTSYGHIIHVRVIFTNRRRYEVEWCDVYCQNER